MQTIDDEGNDDIDLDDNEAKQAMTMRGGVSVFGATRGQTFSGCSWYILQYNNMQCVCTDNTIVHTNTS